MDEMLLHIVSTINANVSLTETLVGGQLDTGNSLAIQIAPTANETEFLDRTNIIGLSLLLLSKNVNQQTALQDLNNIVNYLSNLETYPQPGSGNFQWITTEVTTYPNFVDKQDNQHYIYSAIINNKIFQ